MPKLTKTLVVGDRKFEILDLSLESLQEGARQVAVKDAREADMLGIPGGADWETREAAVKKHNAGIIADLGADPENWQPDWTTGRYCAWCGEPEAVARSWTTSRLACRVCIESGPAK